MKYIKSAVLLGLLVSGSSFASCIKSNTIDTPPAHINSDSSRYSLFWLSNTKNIPVEASIVVFDQNGADVTANMVATPNISLAGKGSGGFTLVGNGVTRTVHAEITWSSDTCLETPLTGVLETQWNTPASNSFMSVNLNAGQAF